MNSTSVTVSPTPGNLLDEFEEAYQNCLAPLIREDPLTCVDLSELRTNSEANTAHFLEMGRTMQAFFLQKRFQLAAQKPELAMMEDVAELRGELARKDELIKKQSEKLAQWQETIVALQTRPGSNTPCTLSSTPASSYTIPSNSAVAQSNIPVGGACSMTSVMGGPRPSMMPQQPVSMGGCGGQPMSPMGVSPVGLMMGCGITTPTQGGHVGLDNNSRTGVVGGLQQQHIGGGGGSSPHLTMGASVNSPGGPMMAAAQQQGVPVTGFTGGGGSSPLMMGGYGGGFGGGMGRGGVPPQGGGGLQGPLAFLEKTTTNIGMP